MKRITPIFCLMLLTATIAVGSDFEKIQKKYTINTAELLTIYLEIDAGELTVSRNDTAAEIVVSGRINEKYDELDVGYDERNNEFSLIVDRKKWLKSVTDDNSSELEIKLPDDVVLDFRNKFKAGSFHLELGGLSIENFELRNLAGEVRVDFRQPNKIEMKSLNIAVKIGETVLNRLGNARFSEANINAGIGELQVDLSGEGLAASEIEIDLDVGSTTIYLPTDQGIKLKSTTWGFLTNSHLDSGFDRRGRYYFSKNYRAATKTLFVTIHSGIGELRVDLR